MTKCDEMDFYTFDIVGPNPKFLKPYIKPILAKREEKKSELKDLKGQLHTVSVARTRTWIRYSRNSLGAPSRPPNMSLSVIVHQFQGKGMIAFWNSKSLAAQAKNRWSLKNLLFTHKRSGAVQLREYD